MASSAVPKDWPNRLYSLFVINVQNSAASIILAHADTDCILIFAHLGALGGVGGTFYPSLKCALKIAANLSSNKRNYHLAGVPDSHPD
jgi:hypothetical protein